MKSTNKEFILRSHPILSLGNNSVIEFIAASEGCTMVDFLPDQTIYSDKSNDSRLGFVVSGRAAVFSSDPERKLLLRYLNTGDITGVVNLFDGQPFVSRIIAVTKCKMLFIDGKTWGMALEMDPNLMYGYINFLSEKIDYLNKKIIYLTAGSAERRVALWLESHSDNETVDLPHNISNLADLLNISRASLYRAFDTLEKQGLIGKDGKSIFIVDRKNIIAKYIQTEELL